MTHSIAILTATAAGVGFLHTLLGPDHYLPFVAMARAGRWSMTRTLTVTLLCGAGHVIGSVMLGIVGIAAGRGTADALGLVESQRGAIAGWLLLGFGMAYSVWGVHRAIRHRPHSHAHMHADGTVHTHPHGHTAEHSHVHADARSDSVAGAVTPWVLFTIFVFGPCEPLIPIMLAAAGQAGVWGATLVTIVFGVVTLMVMTAIVTAATFGLTRLHVGRYERFSHVAAGLSVLACGAAVVFFNM